MLPCFDLFSFEVCVSDPFCSGASSLRAVPTAAKPAATAAFFATCVSFAPALETEVFFFDFTAFLVFAVFLVFALAAARFAEDLDLVRLVAFFMFSPGSLDLLVWIISAPLAAQFSKNSEQIAKYTSEFQGRHPAQHTTPPAEGVPVSGLTNTTPTHRLDAATPTRAVRTHDRLRLSTRGITGPDSTPRGHSRRGRARHCRAGPGLRGIEALVCGVSSRPSFGTSAAHELSARCLTIRVTSVSRMRAPIRSERLQVILPADEIEAIEDFRYKARMPSLAAAVRELLRRGLASDKED